MKFCLWFFVGLFVIFSYSDLQPASIAKTALAESLSEQKLDLKEQLKGCWQAETKEDLMIRFQDKKFFIAQEGRLQKIISIAGYQEGKIVFCMQGVSFSLGVINEGQKLKISCEKNSPCSFLKIENNSTFKRMESAPEVLEPQAMILAESVELSEKRIKEIRAEMIRRGELDQGIRQKPDADDKEMEEIDTNNVAYLIGLIKEVGWIDKSRFGEQASTGAFFIVQHSHNFPLMMTALPKLKKDGFLGFYALMYDRLQIMMAEKQLYGSQFFGKAGLMPLEDPENVDKRRKEMGLEPMAQHVTKFGLKEIKILNWDCN